MDIDELDKRILNALIDNSRLSYRQIAKKIKVSVVTVMNRVKKLEKEGIIKKYTCLVDYEKLNYGFFVAMNVRISKGKEHDVEKKLALNENVYAIYDITGDFDVEIIGKFKTRHSLDEFVKKIQTFEFVERVNTKLILNIMKEDPIRVS
jgi:DNA-binding Lrp family transcriptional regulator